MLRTPVIFALTTAVVLAPAVASAASPAVQVAGVTTTYGLPATVRAEVSDVPADALVTVRVDGEVAGTGAVADGLVLAAPGAEPGLPGWR